MLRSEKHSPNFAALDLVLVRGCLRGPSVGRALRLSEGPKRAPRTGSAAPHPLGDGDGRGGARRRFCRTGGDHWSAGLSFIARHERLCAQYPSRDGLRVIRTRGAGTIRPARAAARAGLLVVGDLCGPAGCSRGGGGGPLERGRRRRGGSARRCPAKSTSPQRRRSRSTPPAATRPRCSSSTSTQTQCCCVRARARALRRRRRRGLGRDAAGRVARSGGKCHRTALVVGRGAVRPLMHDEEGVRRVCARRRPRRRLGGGGVHVLDAGRDAADAHFDPHCPRLSRQRRRHPRAARPRDPPRRPTCASARRRPSTTARRRAACGCMGGAAAPSLCPSPTASLTSGAAT